MRTLPTTRFIVCWLCLVGAINARADVVVIVNPDNPVPAMTQREVSDLYLGRKRSFDTGDQTASLPALVYEQPIDSPLRAAFFHALNGMSIDRLNAYWARLRFSGEVLPPATLADSRRVLETVRHNRNAIGYVDSSVVNDSVKIVLRLKE